MNVILADLYYLRDFIERELLPAAEGFKAINPASKGEDLKPQE
jgi:hypothetical protein